MIPFKKIAAGALLAVSLVACNNTTHGTTTTVHGGSNCHNVVTTSHHRQRVQSGRRVYYRTVTSRSTHVVCHH